MSEPEYLRYSGILIAFLSITDTYIYIFIFTLPQIQFPCIASCKEIISSKIGLSKGTQIHPKRIVQIIQFRVDALFQIKNQGGHSNKHHT